MIVVPIVLALAGGVLVALGQRAMEGTLPRNTWAGIRISSTMRSDAAWVAGHKAGGGALTIAGWVALAGGVTMIPFVIFDKPTGYGVVVGVTLVTVLALVLVASVRASRAAKQVP